MASGAFPVETMAIIEEDIRATLPALHIFHPETGPLYQDLKDLLSAWVVSRSDEGLGYVSLGSIYIPCSFNTATFSHFTFWVLSFELVCV